MVAGEARRQVSLAPSARYLALDKRGRPHWETIWDGNPDMARPGEPHDGTIEYVNGLRPYIASSTKARYTFREYKPHPAFIALPKRAQQMAILGRSAVVFNPTIKPGAPMGKLWPDLKWRELVATNKHVRWLQIGSSTPLIAGAETIRTGDLFEALGVMSGALAVVCHEGALHHGAAALSIPTVVIRGGFIGPRVTGYAGQADLFVDDPRYPLGCGMRVRCPHCVAAMASIQPRDVMAALQTVLREKVAA